MEISTAEEKMIRETGEQGLATLKRRRGRRTGVRGQGQGQDDIRKIYSEPRDEAHVPCRVDPEHLRENCQKGLVKQATVLYGRGHSPRSSTTKSEEDKERSWDLCFFVIGTNLTVLRRRAPRHAQYGIEKGRHQPAGYERLD